MAILKLIILTNKKMRLKKDALLQITEILKLFQFLETRALRIVYER